MNPQETFDALKEFMGFDSSDEEKLRKVAPWIKEYGPKITDAFYTRIGSTPELAKYVEGKIDHLKKTHIKWMNELVAGDYGADYFESRWKIGLAHVNVGLDPIWVDGTMSLIRGDLLVRMAETEEDAALLRAATGSLLKICDLDLAIINLAYAEDRLDRLTDFTGMKRSLIENIIRLPKTK